MRSTNGFDDDGSGGSPFADTFFVYETGQVVLEFDGDDDTNLSHRYAWGLLVDQAIADEQVSSLGSAGAVLWTFGDHLGTIRDLVTYNSTTDDAIVANHREWDSYGNLLSQSNVTYASTIGYTGRMWDITTGLQWNLHRWYDAAVGKWISEDPIGFAGGNASLSGYVNNQIISTLDPTGLAPPEVCIGFRPPQSPSFSLSHLYSFVRPVQLSANNDSTSKTFSIPDTYSTIKLYPGSAIGVPYKTENLGARRLGHTAIIPKRIKSYAKPCGNGYYTIAIEYEVRMEIILNVSEIHRHRHSILRTYGHEQRHMKASIEFYPEWFGRFAVTVHGLA